jgi:hypothetical protein
VVFEFCRKFKVSERFSGIRVSGCSAEVECDVVAVDVDVVAVDDDAVAAAAAASAHEADIQDGSLKGPGY